MKKLITLIFLVAAATSYGQITDVPVKYDISTGVVSEPITFAADNDQSIAAAIAADATATQNLRPSLLGVGLYDIYTTDNGEMLADINQAGLATSDSPIFAAIQIEGSGDYTTLDTAATTSRDWTFPDATINLTGLAQTTNTLPYFDTATSAATYPMSQFAKANMNLGLFNLLDAINDAIYDKDDDGNLSVVSVTDGDSLGGRAMAAYNYNIWCAIGQPTVSVGMNATSGVDYKPNTAGGLNVKMTVENTATLTSADFSYLSNGQFWTMDAASDAIRAYSNGDVRLYADELVVYYLKTDGGGTFKIQSSTTSISSGFADETGYTAIDTDNGSTDELGIARIPVTYDDYAVRCEYVSGGDVVILGVYFDVYDGAPSLNLLSMAASGSDAGAVAGCNATMMGDWIADIKPQVWGFMFDDTEDRIALYCDALATWIANADVPEFTVIGYGCGPKGTDTPTSDEAIAEANETLQTKCIDNGWAYVPTHALGGSDWDALDDAGGTDGDTTHLKQGFYDVGGNYASRVTGIPTANTYVSKLNNTSTETAISIRTMEFQRADYPSPAGILSASDGYNLDVDVARAIRIFDSTGSTVHWDLSTGVFTTPQIPSGVEVGDGGPVLTDNGGVLEVDGERVLDETDLTSATGYGSYQDNYFSSGTPFVMAASTTYYLPCNGLTTYTAELPSDVSAYWTPLTINYDAETSGFTLGATLTGGTSGDTAIITSIVDNGTTGTLYLATESGAVFTDNETITDGSGGSATADGIASGGIIPSTEGDAIIYTIEFTAKPTGGGAAASYVEFWIDIGGGVGELYRRIVTFPKGAGVERNITTSTAAYSLDTWESNGGAVYMSADGQCDIYNARVIVYKIHEAAP